MTEMLRAGRDDLLGEARLTSAQLYANADKVATLQLAAKPGQPQAQGSIEVRRGVPNRPNIEKQSTLMEVRRRRGASMASSRPKPAATRETAAHRSTLK